MEGSAAYATDGSTASEANAVGGGGAAPGTGRGGCARCSGWPEELIRARAAASYWEAMHRVLPVKLQNGRSAQGTRA